jgi:DNA-binding transcriptional LysR family regulator
MLNQIDLSRTDLNLLTLFEVVMAEGHVGRAAERLHLTPSAVSHGLGRLRRLLNDPLFLRTPKGVVPTARAAELAQPIGDVLARARSVLSVAEPFDPARSTRRFTLGAPDGVSAVVLAPLMEALREHAPGVDIALRQVLPTPGETSVERAWQFALTELESRVMDLAILPIAEAPARFHRQLLFEEDFVLAMRARHPLSRRVTLERYCDCQHLVVSWQGEASGFVDQVLAGHGRQRRIALTVPNFMMALAVLADSDLVAALPRRFVQAQGPRFGVVAAEPPVALGHFGMQLIAPRVAMVDEGVAWLAGLLAGQKKPGGCRACGE